MATAPQVKSVTTGESVREGIIGKIERAVVIALRALIMLLVTAATALLYILFIKGLPHQIGQITSADSLLAMMQTGLGGVLAVVLGLELSETLKSYFAHHQVRLEVILVLATIAVSRYLIQIDFEHTSAAILLGIGALILCLTIGYLLVKKANFATPTEPVDRRESEPLSAQSPHFQAPDGDGSKRMR